MEMWTARMYFNFILLFAMLLGSLAGKREEIEEIEEIDNSIMPLSAEICLTKLDKMSRKDLIRIHELISIILSEKKTAKEPVCTADAVNSAPCFCKGATIGSGSACNAKQKCNMDGTCHDDSCQNQDGNGRDYVGMASQTVSGHTCQKWTSQSPHRHGWGSMGDHNYCRNPDGEQGVWCYTTDPAKRWELCDVSVCVCTADAVNAAPCFCEDALSGSGAACNAQQICNVDGTCHDVCTADAVNSAACFCKGATSGAGAACNAKQLCNMDGTCHDVCTADAVNSAPCFCKGATSGSGAACNAKQKCNLDGTCHDDCVQTLNLSNREGKIISSPGFLENQNYSNNLNCKWTFTAPYGEKVSMTILHMNTEYGYDVIRVLDGISEEDDKLPILATMSGEEKLEAVISSSSQMTIIFTSDVNVNMTGFQANVGAFKKADLPQFEWIDLFTLNITYPTGEIETISLTRGADGENICIFEGTTSETSVIITSTSSTNECKSLDQFIEIMVRSKYMEDEKRIYTIRNGRLQQIDVNVFGNNELVRKNDTQLNKMKVEEAIPTKIRIPIQFGFDQTLVNKFIKYEHDKSYIKKRLLEIFNGVKLNLKNILHKTDVEFTLEKRMIYINKELKVNDATLMESRKYQLREDIPLVIFCAEDYSNIKGLSFRSGACRKNKERFGVIMITWRDDGSLAADVLEHELGHLIGGVHNQKNGTETHVGHTDFNSDNINTWFTLAGDRCYGKNCSSPPDMTNGFWICDTELHSCDLNCDWGFTTLPSTIQCQNGNWSQNIHDMACTPSLFLVAGGYGAQKDVEMFHPEIENLNCTKKPPALTLEWRSHTTFTHRGTIYLCGGYYTRGMCISYNGGNSWSTHSLQQHRYHSHSSVVIGQTIFLIGGENDQGYPGVEQSRLPFLTDTPTWSPVPNMPYKGEGQCSVKVDSKSFLVIGGYKDGADLNTVSKYNVVEETTEALAPLIHARDGHGCLVKEENGTTWIIVTGGMYAAHGWNIKSTEILNLSDSRHKWMSIGELNVARRVHGMALTLKGPMVVGGWDNNKSLKTMEVLNWKTKLWTQFEQSLTTARHNYGGVIEIPRHVFNCELNVETGCPDIPHKEKGIWCCDSTNTSCLLICDPGFSSAYTTTTCTEGVWKEINKMECTESVFILAGGKGAVTNVEIFHPEVPNIKCSSPPPSLDLDWSYHTSFTHQGTIYLCGGWTTKGNCTTYNTNDNNWSLHSLQKYRQFGHSSVVFGDSFFLIGGEEHRWYYSEVEESRFPFLTDTASWSSVPHMPYKGVDQCSVKTGVNSFVVTGGYWSGAGVFSKVTRYNIENETTEALAPLIQSRKQHGCLVKQENGETWIIVTGGWYAFSALNSTEILNLSDISNVWISIGELNEARDGHGMALTIKGPIVVGGRANYDKNRKALNSIEVLNWQTKVWTQFEQSVTNARHAYGGVIELPAHLFGCETQPITITGCTGEYKYDKEFIGGAATPVGQDQTCHSLCQNDDDCLGWTWTGKKKCRIITQQSALDSLQSKNGSVSGVKNSCKPKCYLVLSDNEEASTNTQFCTDQNTETDCLNMIHLEPDDFQPADNGSIKICHHDQDKGMSYCEDVDYENVDLLCNPDPGIVTLSTYQRINKHRYIGHLKPYFGYGRN